LEIRKTNLNALIIIDNDQIQVRLGARCGLNGSFVVDRAGFAHLRRTMIIKNIGGSMRRQDWFTLFIDQNC
jgi:hypothetical protein